MRYLKHFESNSIDVRHIVTNDVFLSFFDDDMAEIIDNEDGGISISIDTDEPDREYNKEDISDLAALYQKRASVYKRLKIATTKLTEHDISYNISEINDDYGYIIINIFTNKFDSEYFQISVDDKLYVKTPKLRADFNCNIWYSSSGSITIRFGEKGTEDLAKAKEIYEILKKIEFNGESLVQPFCYSRNSFSKGTIVGSTALKNNNDVPIGPHFEKNGEQYAEFLYRKTNTTSGGGYYARADYRHEYSIGLTTKYKLSQ